MLPIKPSVVVITETWLDSNTEFPLLSGYYVAARLDRCNSVHANETDCDSEEGEIEDSTTTPGTRKKGGGVIVFAMDNLKCIVHLEDSCKSERVWLTVHTNYGPLLVSGWYRRPARGEVESIESLAIEHSRL